MSGRIGEGDVCGIVRRQRQQKVEENDVCWKGHRNECFRRWMRASNLGKGRTSGGKGESVVGVVVDDGDDDGGRGWTKRGENGDWHGHLTDIFMRPF